VKTAAPLKLLSILHISWFAGEFSEGSERRCTRDHPEVEHLGSTGCIGGWTHIGVDYQLAMLNSKSSNSARGNKYTLQPTSTLLAQDYAQHTKMIEKSFHHCLNF